MREKTYQITEICERLGVEQEFVIHSIRAEWIIPEGAGAAQPPEAMELDEEDLARLTLILELKEDFGVNEEAIPLILHLLDQLHFLRRRIESARPSRAA